MTDLVKVPKQGADLIAQLLEGQDKAVESSLPDDLPAKTVVQYGRAAASLMDRNDKEKSILGAVLGRIHALARSRPDVLKEAKCTNLKEFEKLLGGAARSTIWNGSMIYDTFAEQSLALKEYAEIGTSKLLVAARKAGKDSSPAQKRKLLDRAKKEETVDQFREWVETKFDPGSEGSTSSASFQVVGSRAEIKELKEFLADPKLIEWSGVNTAIGILLAALKESSSEWSAEPTVLIPDDIQAPPQSRDEDWV